MNFLQHPNFAKEIRAIKRRHSKIEEGIATIEKLLSQQFHPVRPAAVIGPSKIHRLHQEATLEIWKVEVAVPKSGLRPSQWPRVWFGLQGDTIAFLITALHGSNYDDNTVTAIAYDRATDIF